MLQPDVENPVLFFFKQGGGTSDVGSRVPRKGFQWLLEFYQRFLKSVKVFDYVIGVENYPGAQARQV
jgi:hypothetical protein